MSSTNWKKFIHDLLSKNNAFHLEDTLRRGHTDVEIYKNKSDIIFEVGYFDKGLIFMHLSHPEIPGYIEHTKGEYFYDDHFDISRQSKVGLNFDVINKKGIKGFIENGLHGREEQFILNREVIYSKLYFDELGYHIRIDFTNRTFWQRIFGPKIEKIKGIQRKTINLNDVFAGIK